MRFRFVLALTVLAGFGCGRDKGDVVPVSGKVTLDGRPLARAFVEFQPMAQGGDPSPGPTSRGQTDAQGNFSLHVVGGPQAGAVPGKHRVRITASKGEVPRTTDDADPKLAPQLLPEWYNTETTLTCDVPAKGTASADFKLTLDHRFAPVSGTVTLDGVPLGNVLVVFQPQARSPHLDPGPRSSGKTEANGRFTLKVEGRKEAGAVVGLHLVRIIPLPESSPRPNGAVVNLPAPATLTFRVTTQGTQAADLSLTSETAAADRTGP